MADTSLTAFDSSLAEGVKFRIIIQNNKSKQASSSKGGDRNIGSQAAFGSIAGGLAGAAAGSAAKSRSGGGAKAGTSGKDIPFQFPPRIVSETKQSEWKKKNVKSFEPIALYRGSSARSLTLEAEYVATGSANFTPEKIAQILRDIKEYFYDASAFKPFKAYPVVELKAYNIVPTPAFFRMHSFNATYSDAFVKADDFIFPLHTKISMSLELVTRITMEQGDKKGRMRAKPLMPMRPEWF